MAAHKFFWLMPQVHPHVSTRVVASFVECSKRTARRLGANGCISAATCAIRNNASQGVRAHNHRVVIVRSPKMRSAIVPMLAHCLRCLHKGPSEVRTHFLHSPRKSFGAADVQEACTKVADLIKDDGTSKSSKRGNVSFILL